MKCLSRLFTGGDAVLFAKLFSGQTVGLMGWFKTTAVITGKSRRAVLVMLTHVVDAAASSFYITEPGFYTLFIVFARDTNPGFFVTDRLIFSAIGQI